MDLSIIIVNWNGGNFLEKCLNSIYKTIKNLDFEVFVVDNASSDLSLNCLKKFPEMNLIKNTENKGFAQANNQAIKKSKGNYILLLNPDTILLKNSIQKMISYMSKNEDIGVLGCKLLNPDGSVQPSCHAFLTLPHVFFEVSQMDKIFPKNKFFTNFFKPLTKFKLFMNYSTPEKPIEVESVMGSCYMIRKESLSKTGLLDENFFLYHEEMELSYRIWQKGYKVIFFPYSTVIHYNKHATEKNKNKVYYERFKSILYFFKKQNKTNLKLLKLILLFSLSINLLSIPFRKNIKTAFKYRMKTLKLL